MKHEEYMAWMDRFSEARSLDALDRLRNEVAELPDSWEKEDFGEVLVMLRENMIARGDVEGTIGA